MSFVGRNTRSSKKGRSTIIPNNDERIGSIQKRKNLKLSLATLEEGSLSHGLSQGKSMITRLLHDEVNVQQMVSSTRQKLTQIMMKVKNDEMSNPLQEALDYSKFLLSSKKPKFNLSSHYNKTFFDKLTKLVFFRHQANDNYKSDHLKFIKRDEERQDAATAEFARSQSLRQQPSR